MFDLLCGSRMHCAFICLLGCADDVSFGLFDYLLLICVTTTFLLDILDLIIVNNKILFLRLRGLSVFCM
jgi:NADH:ubiquinone oxidoreductase subunit D